MILADRSDHIWHLLLASYKLEASWHQLLVCGWRVKWMNVKVEASGGGGVLKKPMGDGISSPNTADLLLPPGASFLVPPRPLATFPLWLWPNAYDIVSERVYGSRRVRLESKKVQPEATFFAESLGCTSISRFRVLLQIAPLSRPAGPNVPSLLQSLSDSKMLSRSNLSSSYSLYTP